MILINGVDVDVYAHYASTERKQCCTHTHTYARTLIIINDSDHTSITNSSNAYLECALEGQSAFTIAQTLTVN